MCFGMSRVWCQNREGNWEPSGEKSGSFCTPAMLLSGTISEWMGQTAGGLWANRKIAAAQTVATRAIAIQRDWNACGGESSPWIRNDGVLGEASSGDASGSSGAIKR
jgi:hypothetical protein